MDKTEKWRGNGVIVYRSRALKLLLITTILTLNPVIPYGYIAKVYFAELKWRAYFEAKFLIKIRKLILDQKMH